MGGGGRADSGFWIWVELVRVRERKWERRKINMGERDILDIFSVFTRKILLFAKYGWAS